MDIDVDIDVDDDGMTLRVPSLHVCDVGVAGIGRPNLNDNPVDCPEYRLPQPDDYNRVKDPIGQTQEDARLGYPYRVSDHNAGNVHDRSHCVLEDLVVAYRSRRVLSANRALSPLIISQNPESYFESPREDENGMKSLYEQAEKIRKKREETRLSPSFCRLP
jgi:hypothetical protein